MLRAEAVYHSYGDSPLLEGVTFTIPTGSLAALIGPSGGGKSVLLKMLGGIYSPLKGTVSAEVDAEHGIGLMFQEGALFDSLSVFDNVAFPLVRGQVPTYTLGRAKRAEVKEVVESILSRVGLSNAAHKVPGELSGGMRRRVSLARALVARPKVLLLDDPTSGLDPVASQVIMNLIVEIHRECTPTTLIVSHDLRRLLPVAERVYALFNGRIEFEGTLQELLCCPCSEVREFVACRYDVAPLQCGSDFQPKTVP